MSVQLGTFHFVGKDSGDGQIEVTADGRDIWLMVGNGCEDGAVRLDTEQARVVGKELLRFAMFLDGVEPVT